MKRDCRLFLKDIIQAMESIEVVEAMVFRTSVVLSNKVRIYNEAEKEQSGYYC